MSTRKIAEPPTPPCRHPEHNPPSMMVFEPGTYEHECPACHRVMTFTVQRPYMSAFDKALRKWRDYRVSCLDNAAHHGPWALR